MNISFENTENKLDSVGRVIDFSEIKNCLCQWLDENWDHRFLVWIMDPWRDRLLSIDDSIVLTDFNPTAENLAIHLVEKIGPKLFTGKGITLSSCTVEETRKCSATFELGIYH